MNAPAPASAYAPPRWLRNAHVQSVLGSSALRRRRGERALAECGATTRAVDVDGGAGVRLHGLHSRMPDAPSRGLVLLLHGWEGSADSSYMRLTAAQLLRRGFEVFRLNFRDHGDTHHLNPDLFHSNRLDEVVQATLDIARQFPARPMFAAGYSLGGNFALRLGLQAGAGGLPLVHVAAVCPVLDPGLTMEQMERGLWLYLRYFENKWRGSLQRKRQLFPDHHDFDDATLKLGMRELTRWMVQRHTDFGSLDAYFDGYSIAGDRLAALRVGADILMSEDDPVIPVAGFRALRLPANARLEVAQWGGHCGFIEGPRLDGYAERWVADRIAHCAASRAATPPPASTEAPGPR